ncbi:MAG: YCF48-related protein [Candidatus Omnitrophota bacterium]|jgi:hypothetical protein
MEKYAIVLAVILLLFVSPAGVSLADIVWNDIGRENLDLRTVLIDPDNPEVIYSGSSNAVLKSEDGGESWRSIFTGRGTNKGVNFLLFALNGKNSLYAATGSGLYFSHNGGKNWSRIFKGRDYLENECTTIALLPAAIYLGTKAGLFVSRDKGRSWQRQEGEIGKAPILAITSNLSEPNFIYVACAGGVFKTKDAGQSWEKIFVAHSAEEKNDNDTENGADEQEEATVSSIRYLAIEPDNPNHLYLASGRGVYYSQDRGLNWEPLSTFGLLNRDVKFLLISAESHVYAVTKSGVFAYKDERWQELSLGLATEDIRFLALDKENNLYAAGDKGLFKANLVYAQGSGRTDMLFLYSKDEPGINEVQQAAIKYAEVEPEKIKIWREKAAKSALLPKLSIGIDRNTTDLWHWESGSTTKPDDDTLVRGRDSLDWDVSLSWDLSELIWNEDQTAIDVRSKLMVQLRDDVLDEVTKLYFERIRLKMELDGLSIEDRKKRFEKELKLRELTAHLDALTGGYFSQQITP